MSDPADGQVLERLAVTIASRRGLSGDSSYVASLFNGGEDTILKKIGEETTELLLAAKSGDREHLVAEAADLWFHMLVLLSQHDLGPAQVFAELSRREGVSGHDEKAARPG